MLMVAMVSYFFTPQRVFEANEFSWRPFIEVGWIFLGIFGTMIPVLDYVELHAGNFRLATNADSIGAPAFSPACSITRRLISRFWPSLSASLISTSTAPEMSRYSQ